MIQKRNKVGRPQLSAKWRKAATFSIRFTKEERDAIDAAASAANASSASDWARHVLLEVARPRHQGEMVADVSDRERPAPTSGESKASVGEAPLGVGDLVEWDMSVAPRTRRGHVVRIEPSGRVVVKTTATNHRGPRRTRDVECWFDEGERDLLRVVERAQPSTGSPGR